MIYAINYADDTMSISRRLNSSSALKCGVDKVCMFNKGSIDNDFYSFNREILNSERGVGFWLWKPYFILKVMEYPFVKDGDFIIYADAGIEYITDVNKLLEKVDSDVFLFGNMWNHRDWCKGDVMKAINHRVVFDLFEEKQVQASVVVFRVSECSRRFVREWLAWCQMPGLIDDSPSSHPNWKEFADHRHDQAILTCLQIKHGLKLHWWPAMYSGGAFTYEKTGYSDKYPVMFHHHRRRDLDW